MNKKNIWLTRMFWLRSYFLDKIFPLIMGGFIGFLFTLPIKNTEILDLKKEIESLQHKMPEMPVTVVDSATGNQLYIGRPIPKPTYYEFPITLNDGKGSYRIDQYRLFNDFKGVLIIQKEKQ